MGVHDYVCFCHAEEGGSGQDLPNHEECEHDFVEMNKDFEDWDGEEDPNWDKGDVYLSKKFTDCHEPCSCCFEYVYLYIFKLPGTTKTEKSTECDDGIVYKALITSDEALKRIKAGAVHVKIEKDKWEDGTFENYPHYLDVLQDSARMKGLKSEGKYDYAVWPCSEDLWAVNICPLCYDFFLSSTPKKSSEACSRFLREIETNHEGLAYKTTSKKIAISKVKKFLSFLVPEKIGKIEIPFQNFDRKSDKNKKDSQVFSPNIMENSIETVRRWECPSSSGGKFWEVVRKGSAVTTSWGKLKSKGQTKTTDHVDEAKAIKFVETTIKKKEKEGYVLKTVSVDIKTFEVAQIKPVTKKEPAAKTSAKVKKEIKSSSKTQEKSKVVLKKKAAPVDANKERDEESEAEEDGDVPKSYVLPALYSIDAKNKERIWKIWVVKNKVTKMHGETNGKQTTAHREYEGKSIGRTNETSAEEQANREAERDWVKQVDKGYKPKTKEGLSVYKKITAEKAKQGGVNTNVAFILAYELRNVTIELPKPKVGSNAAKAKEIKDKKKLDNGTMPNYKCEIYPMGCQKWSPDPKNAENPEPKVLKYFDFEAGVYIQPKLDGIRALVRIVKDAKGKQWVVMISRQANQFVHLKHLRKEVLIFLKGHEDIILDCEIYAEEVTGSYKYGKPDPKGKKKVIFFNGEHDELLPDNMRFKAITASIRSAMTDPAPFENQMKLYVFDIVDPTQKINQVERYKILDKLFSRKIASACPNIKQVERKEIYSVEEITKYHDEVATRGYEGVVLRSKDCVYECLKKNKKSKWMRKFKYFLDSEFEIIGVKRDKGVDREQFTWICQTAGTKSSKSVKFYPKPEGTREMKWEWYDNKDDYIGKMLTVRYQGLEDNGVPRFPIGIEMRDYE